jgi:hypothetical protein
MHDIDASSTTYDGERGRLVLIMGTLLGMLT